MCGEGAPAGLACSRSSTGQYRTGASQPRRPHVSRRAAPAGIVSRASHVYLFAHIGNIPVEEWLPFLVPLIVLYVYGRRRDRRRRAEVASLPGAGELLDEATVDAVLAHLAESRHGDASARFLPLLYPPGPDGMTVGQIAAHAHLDPDAVARLLDELEELGYVEREGADGPGQIVTLTIEGYDLVNQTEAALLSCARARSGHPA